MKLDSSNSETPTDLHEMMHGVDALAAAERAAAPAGLEDRVHAASMSSLAPSLRLVHAEAPVVTVRPISRWISPVRIAAAIALFSTIGISYLAINGRSTAGQGLAQIDPGSVPGAAVADIEHFLTIANSDDSVAAELDLLIADTERVREGIHKAPVADEGAM